jgi:hypothetical protein
MKGALPVLPPFPNCSLQKHIAAGQEHLTLYVVPLLHVSELPKSQETAASPPPPLPPLPPPVCMQTIPASTPIETMHSGGSAGPPVQRTHLLPRHCGSGTPGHGQTPVWIAETAAS